MELIKEKNCCKVFLLNFFMKIGIDIGRVIIAGDTDQAKEFFSKNYLTTLAVEDAFTSIQKLAAAYGNENIYLVSKCGSSTAQKTLHWLEHHNFFETTGVDKNHIFFCEERWQKSLICEEQAINIFIDDRYSVLEHLTNLHQLYLFNPAPNELEKFKKIKDAKYIKLVMTWQEILADLV